MRYPVYGVYAEILVCHCWMFAYYI